MFTENLDERIYDTGDYDKRREIIKSIDALINGVGFDLYFNRFILGTSGRAKNTNLSKEDYRKFYVSYNYMAFVVEKFVSYMPKLKCQTNENEDINKITRDALDYIKWDSVLYETICVEMEKCGDVFLSIYFKNDDDKIPSLKILRTENVVDIIFDDNGGVIAYVYDENKPSKKISKKTGEIVEIEIPTKRYIYEVGKTTIYSDDKVTEILNRDVLSDKISIIHIPTYKDPEMAFSKIPAKKYIDDVLTLDRCTTTLRVTLDYQGFSLKHVVDGVIDPKSKPVPGGYVVINTSGKTLSNGIQAKVMDFQIKNQLEANFKEMTEIKTALFEKAKLIAPSTELIVGRSDSAKVFQHFRLPLHSKIRQYRDNIIDGMKKWFYTLLNEEGVYTDELEGFSFYEDEIIIETSESEKLLAQQLEIATGLKNIDMIKSENGDLLVEIEELKVEREKEKEREDSLGKTTGKKEVVINEGVDIG